MTVLERLAKSIERHWYGSATGNLYLLPLWLIFVVLSSLRRTYYRVFPAKPSNTPVIVIGNIAIGGTGKTPLIAYLALRAKVLGLNPGIVSRGYGGTCDRYPLLVDQNTDVCHSGDEPALLFHTLQCPVVVDPNRAAAVAMLSDLSHQDTDNYVDIILSDDGLQHYAMARQAEIIVSDKTRGMGNGWCLPIGPLREPVARLKQADLHLVNGSDFIIKANSFVHGIGGESVRLEEFFQTYSSKIHAVAGIGNPQRFFTTLRELCCDNECEIIEHSFPDHYDFRQEDLIFEDNYPVVMTAKDWIKCRLFSDVEFWYLDVSAEPTPEVSEKLDQLLLTLRNNHHG